MRKATIKTLCVLLVLMIMFVISGCNFANTAGNTQNDTSDVTQQPSSTDEEKITLSFMHTRMRDSTNANAITLWERIDEFCAANPNITIEHEPLGADAFETKIKTLAAGNEMPDLFYVKGSMVRTFVENQLLPVLDEALENDPEWKNGFLDGIFDDFILNGKIYGIPYQLSVTSIVFYNQEIMNECGITEFPSTWSEFIAAIEKIKEKGYTPIAMGNKGKWVAESCYLSALGDRFTGTDWFNSIKDGKGAKFTEPEFIQSLYALKELADIGAFNSDFNSIDNNQARTIYYNKQAAMTFEGSWAISNIINEATEEIINATKMAIPPAVENGKGNSNAVSGGAGWAMTYNVNLTGKEKDAAIEVLKALSDKDAARICFENGGIPAGKVTDYDESKVNRLSREFMEMMKNASVVPIYDAQLDTAIIEVMNSGLQEMLINVVTPESLAEKIQAEYEKY
jgi:raffinose/stachyose/melibiose transport system substrate-binding protein